VGALSTAASVAIPLLHRGRALAAAIFSAASAAVAAAFVVAAAAVVGSVASRVSAAMPSTRRSSSEPFWPAVRFFCAAFLHGQLRKLFRVLVLVASWRVVLCLAACSEFLGWIFHPVVWIAEQVLNWNKRSRVWGCSCSDSRNPSLLSWVPVKTSDCFVWTLKLVRFLPFVHLIADEVVHCLDALHPLISFLFDLTFSIGIAKGLAMVVDVADEKAQQKLVWMSMNIARMIREAPRCSISNGEAEGSGATEFCQGHG